MSNYDSNVRLACDIEESFQNYEIFIEDNPDKYRGGFIWSISTDDNMWDSGLAFTIEDAITEAKAAVNSL